MKLARQRAHPDFIVDQPVLCILVKLLLRVNVDPVGSELFSNLQTRANAQAGKPSEKMSEGSSREEV